MKSSKTVKTAASVMIPAVIVAAGFMLANDNDHLQKMVNIHILREDSILGEKKAVEKEAHLLQNSVARYKAENAQVCIANDDLGMRVQSQAETIGRLQKESGAAARLRRDLAELQNLQKGLYQERDNYLAENSRLKAQLSGLMAKLAAAEAAEPGVKVAATSMKMAVHNKRAKVTVRSRRARTIDLSVEVSGVRSEDQIYLVVRDCKGHVIAPQSGSVNLNGSQISYSSAHLVSPSEGPVTVHRKIRLDRKLPAGSSVKVEVHSGQSGILGSFEVPLR